MSVHMLLRALVVAAAAGALALPSSAAPGSSPHYTPRDVAFVTITGHGTVTSLPHGIKCPRACRALFVRGTHLQLAAKAAPGWRLVGFSSKWCGNGELKTCAFDLVSPHDCIGGACPLGAFGVRVAFVRLT